MSMCVKILVIFTIISAAMAQENVRIPNFFQPNEINRFQYQAVQNQIPAPYNQPMLTDKFIPFQYFNAAIGPEEEFVPDVVRTLAENAISYWTNNNCVYPPEDFYSVFERSCSEVYKDNNIFSGMCRTFFNASQEICKLEDAEPVERETMLNLTRLQTEVTDDDICDTLLGMKQSSPDLFPSPFGENSWFLKPKEFLFANNSCTELCGSDNMHPICFGILLTYDYINNEKLAIELEKELALIDDYIGTAFDEDGELQEEEMFEAEKTKLENMMIEQLTEDFDENYNILIDDQNQFEVSFNDLGIFDDNTLFAEDDWQLGLEKYYEYKATNEEKTVEDDVKDDKIDGEVLIDLQYLNFGNPKLLNKFKLENDLKFDDNYVDNIVFVDDFSNEKLMYENMEYDEYDQDDSSLMGAVLAFSCLLLLAMLVYIFKMRHRLSGRSNRLGRPNRWNYKKVNTDGGHSY